MASSLRMLLAMAAVALLPAISLQQGCARQTGEVVVVVDQSELSDTTALRFTELRNQLSFFRQTVANSGANVRMKFIGYSRTGVVNSGIPFTSNPIALTTSINSLSKQNSGFRVQEAVNIFNTAFNDARANVRKVAVLITVSQLLSQSVQPAIPIVRNLKIQGIDLYVFAVARTPLAVINEMLESTNRGRVFPGYVGIGSVLNDIVFIDCDECRDCEMKEGSTVVPHRSNCALFYKCQPLRDGGYLKYLQHCPDNLLFDGHDTRVCRPIEDVLANNTNCRICNSPSTAKYSGHWCDTYVECPTGTRTERCCPNRQAFNAATQRCEPSSTCVISPMCATSDPTKNTCPHKPHANKCMYYSSDNVVMTCAPGTAFQSGPGCGCHILDSECNTPPEIRATCTQKVSIPFVTAIRNVVKGPWVENFDAVLTQGGTSTRVGDQLGTFSQSAYLKIPYFTNNEFKKNFVAKFRFKETTQTNAIRQILMTNIPCDPSAPNAPSVEISFNPSTRRVELRAATSRATNTAGVTYGVNIGANMWKEVVYIHDGETLSGQLRILTADGKNVVQTLQIPPVSIPGKLLKKNGALKFAFTGQPAFGSVSPGFTGLMDEINVWDTCVPPNVLAFTN